MGAAASVRVLINILAGLLGWNVESDYSLTDIFPASLIHLSLVEDLVMQFTYDWSEELVLERLGALFAQVMPRIELFEFWPDHVVERWTEELEEKLRELCLWDGVRCIIHQDEEDPEP